MSEKDEETLFRLGDRVYTETKVWVLAQQAYLAYCHEVGGLAFNGDKLPEFKDVPEKIQRAWFVAASTVVVISDSIGVIE